MFTIVKKIGLAIALGAAISGFTPAMAAEMSAAKRDALHNEIRAYLLENPEVILEAINLLEARHQKEAAKNSQKLIVANTDALFNDGYSYVAGNPEGDVTLVEFLDYRCGYCKRAYPGIEKLVKDDGKIRYVIKEFPILGPDSLFAAKIAMASLKQGGDKYMAFHDAMMSHKGALPAPIVMRLARKAGLDVVRLRKDAKDQEIMKNIQSTHALAQKMSVSGTPSFIIGGKVIRGYVTANVLAAIAAKTRATAAGSATTAGN